MFVSLSQYYYPFVGFYKNHYRDNLRETSGSLKKDLIQLPHRGRSQNSKDPFQLWSPGISGCVADSGDSRDRGTANMDVALQLNPLPLVWRVNQAFIDWRLLH